MDEQVAKKIEKFFSNFTKHNLKKGEVIIRAGEAPKGIIYLISGQVKKYAISQNGDEHVVNVFKPISFFPMSWAINSSKNDYFYEAMTDGQIKVAPRNSILEFIRKEHDVLYDLLARVYKGTDGMEKKMMFLMTGRAYPRLITELIIQAKRFGINTASGVVLKIKESDLASQSGMTRETVSRELKILKDRGLIKLERSKLKINSLEELELVLKETL